MEHGNLDRYLKMAEIAQIGWWESDLETKEYVCSEYMGKIFGLSNNRISFSAFLNMIRIDYRDLIKQEFLEYSSHPNEFYERIFPVITPTGEVWIKAHLGFHNFSDKLQGSFGVIMVVPPPVSEQSIVPTDNFNRILLRQNSISRFLVDYLQSKDEKGIINNILKDILHVFNLERIMMYEFSEDKLYMKRTYEFVDKDKYRSLREEIVRTKDVIWWSNQLLSGRSIVMNRLNQMPDEAASDRDILEKDQVKSYIAIPLINKELTKTAFGASLQ
jgi:hypothetical protein